MVSSVSVSYTHLDVYKRQVSHLEFFFQLLIDVLALSALLYFSGGSTNPFISLFLLPLTIAAATLPWRYTWIMAVITIACYTLLLFVYIPLPHEHSNHPVSYTHLDVYKRQIHDRYGIMFPLPSFAIFQYEQIITPS